VNRLQLPRVCRGAPFHCDSWWDTRSLSSTSV